MKKISDYSSFDYKHLFWETQNRDYEDQSEKQTLSRCLAYIKPPIHTLMDAGCGFGRLTPCYRHLAQKVVLFDFAESLLQDAKTTYGHDDAFSFVQGSLYDIPIPSGAIDTLISIRTLHHISDLPQLFSEVSRVLKPDGYFIFEIPNKRHLLNIFRFFIGRCATNPFSSAPYFLSDTFINYHPDFVLSILNDYDFTVLRQFSTGFFRLPLLKYLLPCRILVFFDSVFQTLFSFLRFTPSLYIVAKKQS